MSNPDIPQGQPDSADILHRLSAGFQPSNLEPATPRTPANPNFYRDAADASYQKRAMDELMQDLTLPEETPASTSISDDPTAKELAAMIPAVVRVQTDEANDATSAPLAQERMRDITTTVTPSEAKALLALRPNELLIKIGDIKARWESILPGIPVEQIIDLARHDQRLIPNIAEATLYEEMVQLRNDYPDDPPERIFESLNTLIARNQGLDLTKIHHMIKSYRERRAKS